MYSLAILRFCSSTLQLQNTESFGVRTLEYCTIELQKRNAEDEDYEDLNRLKSQESRILQINHKTEDKHWLFYITKL
jgi:Skp family chaperone for outer membrane proteins